MSFSKQDLTTTRSALLNEGLQQVGYLRRSKVCLQDRIYRQVESTMIWCKWVRLQRMPQSTIVNSKRMVPISASLSLLTTVGTRAHRHLAQRRPQSTIVNVCNSREYEPHKKLSKQLAVMFTMTLSVSFIMLCKRSK